MSGPGESIVREFDHGGQHITISQVYGAGFSYRTDAGAIGANLRSQAEAEREARAVIDDQATRWLKKAVEGNA